MIVIVPSSERLTRSVPGNRPVSVGGSASRQRVATNGYRPRTRNEPPGGGVRRRKLDAVSAGSSIVAEGLGSAEDVEGDAVPSVELGRSPGVDEVHEVHATSTSSSATVARTQTGLPFVPRSGRIILTTLAGRAAGGHVGDTSRRKCDKTTLFGLTAPSPLSYVGPALIGVNRGREVGKGR